MSADGDILLVGCGNMGRALLTGWRSRGIAGSRIRVVDPDPSAIAASRPLSVLAARELSDSLDASAAAVVVLAVKPQILETALSGYRSFAEAGSMFLSIAAGKPTGFYEGILGEGTAVVRAMPNTPAAIGQGVTVLCANANVKPAQRVLAGELMSAVGEVAWLDDESLMDAVTAVSGSGPAYVFLLIECLTEAAVEEGIEPGLARQLAQATVAGAGAYARVAQRDATELRRQVTSPGGTTAAALAILMEEDGLAALVKRAVRAATERGRELA